MPAVPLLPDGFIPARPRPRSGLAALVALVLVSSATLAPAAASAQSPAVPAAEPAARSGRHTLAVTVVGARSDRGLLRVAVFAVPDGFPRNQDAALRREERVLRTPQDTIVFTDLPAGRYAVAVHHDENANRVLDANAFGVPREGWGASTDPRPRLRAPRFDEAAFELNASRQLTIRLTY